MSTTLKIDSIVFLIFIILFILYLVKKEKMSIKYSFVWLLPCLIFIAFILMPGLLTKVSNLLGFEVASNMIFAILIGFLMIIAISLTVIVSRQKEQIRLLIQEVSMLKKKR